MDPQPRTQSLKNIMLIIVLSLTGLNGNRLCYQFAYMTLHYHADNHFLWSKSGIRSNSTTITASVESRVQ